MAQETNPYPPGSARWKLWNRKQADKAKAAEKPPQSDGNESKDDNTRRRRQIDDYLDRAQRGQTTDSNNE